MREVVGEAVYARTALHVRAHWRPASKCSSRTLIDSRRSDRHIQASYIPDIVDGAVQGFYVQATDVTARVDAEQSRDEALRLFQLRWPTPRSAKPC